MQTLLFPADARGTKDIGWLKSRFFFSFSDYHAPDKAAFGTLVAFNDDLLEAGKGFGIHPHANMEIISILLKGRMNHKDSMGYSTVIEPGGVQIMSAGSGLYHEEYNIGDDEVNFLQIWIQPKLQDVRPRYQTRQFDRDNRSNGLTTLISSEEGIRHCWINQNAKLSLAYFDGPNSHEYRFSATNKCLFIFAIEGAISAAGQQLRTRDGLGIWDTDTVTISHDGPAEYLIIETPVNQK